MRFFFVLFLLGVQGALFASQNGCLQVILVANLEDDGIGAHHDIKRMKKNVAVLGQKANLKVNITLLKGRDFTAEKVICSLKRLSLSSKDIVIFYYTGHGFNDKASSSCWPTLYTRKQKIAGNAIVDYLRRQKKQMALVLFDCCNAPYASGHIIRTIKSRKRTTLLLSDPLEKFITLLLSTRGLVIASAASVGEFALASASDGSMFTGLFFRSITKCGARNDVSWDMIFRVTSNYILEDSATLFMSHPLCKIEADTAVRDCKKIT